MVGWCYSWYWRKKSSPPKKFNQHVLCFMFTYNFASQLIVMILFEWYHLSVCLWVLGFGTLYKFSVTVHRTLNLTTKLEAVSSHGVCFVFSSLSKLSPSARLIFQIFIPATIWSKKQTIYHCKSLMHYFLSLFSSPSAPLRLLTLMHTVLTPHSL